MKILITSAPWKAALTTMRSLGKKGHEISLICDDRHSPHLYSKYCKNRIISPSESKKDEYVDFLLKHLKNEKYDLLIPISDICVDYFSEIREELNRYANIFLPDRDILEIALDKVKTCQYALENDVDIPKTYFPENISDIKKIADELSYPCIVKKGKGSAGKGNFNINSKNDLIGHFAGHKEGEWPIIQEYVRGDSYGFMGVCNSGEILEYFIWKRLRQFPERFGITVYAESIFDENILHKMSRILKKIQWTGPFSLDYIINEKGKVILLEINPRLSGAVPFAHKCGVDVPACLLSLMLDKDFIKQPTRYTNGKLFRSIFPEEVNSCRFNHKYIPSFIINFLNPRIVHDIDFSDLSLLKWQIKKAKWGIIG